MQKFVGAAIPLADDQQIYGMYACMRCAAKNVP